MAAKQSRSIGLESRLWAFRAIQSWRASDFYVADFLQRHEREFHERDKSLVRELALGVVRYCGLFESLVKPLLRREQPDQELLDVLSIAAYQIFVLEGIPDHAVGSSSVELTKAIKRPAWSSLVNALVRKLIAMRVEDLEVAPFIGESFMPKKAHKRFSFTKDFIKDLKRDYPNDWQRIASQLNRVPPLCTRTLEGRHFEVDPHQVLQQDGAWTWWHRVQDAVQGPVKEGAAIIQDKSQSHVLSLAQVNQTDLVLDYCAAPGGKSRFCLDAGARVISADISVDRLKPLAAFNLGHRLVQDGRSPACAALFDCVLVDAPCSNSGVFARRPEARWRYLRDNVDELQQLQQRLLEQASLLVKPGGRLIYSTCSINSEENRSICQVLDGWHIEEDIQVLPDEWQAGAYAARLTRA